LSSLSTSAFASKDRAYTSGAQFRCSSQVGSRIRLSCIPCQGRTL